MSTICLETSKSSRVKTLGDLALVKTPVPGTQAVDKAIDSSISHKVLRISNEHACG